jgi:hypothetical protein
MQWDIETQERPMNTKHLGVAVAVAVAAIFSVPAFAQGAGGSAGAAGTAGTAGTPAPASNSVNVNTNTGSQAPAGMTGGVSSGTGVPVMSGTGVAVAPASGPVAPAPRIIPGSGVVPYSTTTVMGGPAPGISSSTTVVTYSWVNVPADAASRGDFNRWQSLK